LKKKIFISVVSIIVLCVSIISIVTPKKINVSKVVDLVQSNYKSISVNDKYIVAGTTNQYLIDDFIPKLSRYAIKTYNGELHKNYSYKVDIKRIDGSDITLLDNDYLVINNRKYEIVEGTINLSKFYNIFMN
jgi:hypothetical protein